MKKRLIPITALALVVLVNACKSKAKEAGADSTSTTTSASATQPATTTPSTPANEPKTYTVTFSPDSAILGKDKEAVIKIKNAKAIALLDPDGKDQGTELSFALEITNKNKIGTNQLFFRTDQSRLTLDNGNNITQYDGGSENIDAESTKEIPKIVYRIPAGAKPKAFNLFFEETRVSVGVDLK